MSVPFDVDALERRVTAFTPAGTPWDEEDCRDVLALIASWRELQRGYDEYTGAISPSKLLTALAAAEAKVAELEDHIESWAERAQGDDA